MKSMIIESVGLDFASQVSDLRKRKEFLSEAQFFGPEVHTLEYARIQNELRMTNNALALAEELEVSPD